MKEGYVDDKHATTVIVWASLSNQVITRSSTTLAENCQ